MENRQAAIAVTPPPKKSANKANIVLILADTRGDRWQVFVAGPQVTQSSGVMVTRSLPDGRLALAATETTRRLLIPRDPMWWLGDDGGHHDRVTLGTEYDLSEVAP